MKNFAGLTIAALGLVLFCTQNTASALTYTVNSQIGSGSVTGTVVTDGTFGVMGGANITDWNLLLNDGTSSFSLLGPLSGANSALLVLGNAFTATATDLLFDFTNQGFSGVLFQNPFIGSAQNWYALEAAFGQIGTGTPSTENLRVGSNPAQDSAARQGVQSWATATGAKVPDSVSTFVMLMCACVSLAAISRRRLN